MAEAAKKTTRKKAAPKMVKVEKDVKVVLECKRKGDTTKQRVVFTKSGTKVVADPQYKRYDNQWESHCTILEIPVKDLKLVVEELDKNYTLSAD